MILIYIPTEKHSAKLFTREFHTFCAHLCRMRQRDLYIPFSFYRRPFPDMPHDLWMLFARRTAIESVSCQCHIQCASEQVSISTVARLLLDFSRSEIVHITSLIRFDWIRFDSILNIQTHTHARTFFEC